MSEVSELPEIIQGGMGIGVSDYRLARSVSEAGGLGVYSGTAIDTVFLRRLAKGDPGGHMRRALASFPFPAVAQSILEKYLVTGETELHPTYKLLSMPKQTMDFDRVAVMVVSAYCETWLSKEGHQAPVGINLMEKIQIPTLPFLFGSMMAGIDVVLMGAGIPSFIPALLDQLSQLETAKLKLHVTGDDATGPFYSDFSPAEFLAECRARSGEEKNKITSLPRPKFFPIISSDVLARRLLKSAGGKIDGFVVEHHVAGGHNAPPRKPQPGDYPYGPADEANLEVMRKLGVPFWLAGDRASRESVLSAKAQGARGVQVGTVFAYCEESGILPSIRRRVIDGCRKGTMKVDTDFSASPTGFPFKIIDDAEQPKEREALRARTRVCDLGHLREGYVDAKGNLGFRCPGEPESVFVKKGGKAEDCQDKLCLCNQLLAAVGLGQTRQGESELALLTAGRHLDQILDFIPQGQDTYTAADVVRQLSVSELPLAREA